MKPQIFAFAMALVLPMTSARAEEQTHTFKVSLFGLTAGYLQVRFKEENGNYAAQGQVHTQGLMAKLAKLDFVGSVAGKTDGPTLWPVKYSATIEKKNSLDTVRISYSNKVPKVLEYSPTRAPRETDVDPAQQKGAVDLISATYMIVRDATAEELCNKTVQMFDGRRRSRIELAEPKIEGKKATCKGTYIRMAGFSKGELEKGTRFPFTSYYEMQGDGTYRLMDVSTKSIVGSAWLHRRN